MHVLGGFEEDYPTSWGCPPTKLTVYFLHSLFGTLLNRGNSGL